MNIDLGLVDSNILIYSLNTASPFFAQANQFLNQITQFVLTPQNILEIYNVVTDPRKFSSPLTSQQAEEMLDELSTSTKVYMIFPAQNTHTTALTLATKIGFTGQQKIYDCFLAATAKENHVEIIYTVNVDDFKKFPFLKVINPLT